MADNLAYENGYREEPWSETLNGAIVLMAPRPALNHSVIADNIYCAFRNCLRGKTCRAFSDGVDVHLTEKDIVIPDSMIVCNKDIIKADGIHGAPDLLVEILSPRTAKRDKGYKKDLYERCGVREYWIVDPQNKSVEVYLNKDGKFVLDDVYQIFPEYDVLTAEEQETYKNAIPVSLFDSFSVPLEDIFYNLF